MLNLLASGKIAGLEQHCITPSRWDPLLHHPLNYVLAPSPFAWGEGGVPLAWQQEGQTHMWNAGKNCNHSKERSGGRGGGGFLSFKTDMMLWTALGVVVFYPAKKVL